MKKILVTGGTGLLGSYLTVYFKQKGEDVIRHGMKTSADEQCDLRTPKDTISLLKKVRPDIIINCVALTNVDKCEEKPNEAYQINVKTAENLIGWVERNPKVIIVHISTDQVYDGTGPHREDDIVITNTYAFSKYCAELAIARVHGIILRTNFFGKSTVEGRDSFSDKLIKNFTDPAPFSLFTDVYFSPLLLNTLNEMVDVVLKNPKPGVYNLGSRQGLSKRDFAHSLAKELKISTNNVPNAESTKSKNLQTYRPLDMRMDVTLFEETYNISLPSLKDEVGRLGAMYEK